MKDTNSTLARVAALAALGESILAAVKTSGLAKPARRRRSKAVPKRRRTTREAVRAGAERAALRSPTTGRALDRPRVPAEPN